MRKISSIAVALWLGQFLTAEAPAQSGRPSETRRSSRTSTSIPKLYQQGMDAYDKKDYQDAAEIFTQILQRQSDNIPSRIQLGRALYQLKKFNEGYKLVQTIDLNLVDPDPSYEFGQLAFRANDYTFALKAFRNVPNGHPLYDLAGY